MTAFSRLASRRGSIGGRSASGLQDKVRVNKARLLYAVLIFVLCRNRHRTNMLADVGAVGSIGVASAQDLDDRQK
jgi:hypothetical protein